MAKTANVILKITDNLQDVSKNAENSKEMFSQVSASVMTLAGGLAALKIGTDILGSIAGAAIEVGMSFESSYAMTTTLMSGTREELAETGNSLLDLSAQYGYAGDVGAQAMYQALSASVDQADALEYLDAAMRTATASGADLTGVVDVSTTIMNAYGKDVEDVDDIMNTLVETQNAGKTTVEELSSTYGAMLPIAAAMGVSFEDVSASVATMTAQGIGTAQAMTMLKSLYSELGKEGTKASESLMNSWQQFGYTSRAEAEAAGMSFQSLMAEGWNVSEVLQAMGVDSTALNERLAELTATGMTQEEAYATLMASGDEYTQSLIDQFGSIEAATAALALSGDNADAYAQNLDRLTDSTYESQDAFNTMTGTAEHSGAVMKEKFNAELTKLYQAVADKLAPAMEFLADNMEVLAPIFITIAIVVGILAVALGVYAISSFIASIATWALISPFLLVIGIVLLVVLAIIGLGLIFMKFKDQIMEALEPVIQKVMEFKDKLVAAFEEFKANVIVIFETLKTALQPFIDMIVALASNIIETVVPAIVSFVSSLWDIIMAIVDFLLPVFKVIGTVIMAVIAIFIVIQVVIFTVVMAIVNVLVSILVPIFEFLWSVVEFVIMAIIGAFQFVWDVISGIISFIVNGFLNLKDNLTTVVSVIVSGVVNGFNSMKNGIGAVFSWVIDKFMSFKDKIVSIKDSIVGAFKNMMTGIASGISSGIDTLIAKVKSMVNTFMITPLNSAIGVINKIPNVSIPTIPSLAIGTNLVNADGIAMLHKGEAVVPADVVGGGFDRSQIKNEVSKSGDTYVIEGVTFYGDDKTMIDKFFDAVDKKMGRRVKRGVRYR